MMPTSPITHALAWGTTTAHPWRDAIASSEAEGLALDARVLALADVSTASPAVETELRSLAAAISAAATREASGGQYADRVLAWRNAQMGTLRGHATRLGYDAQALELR
jgi:hypothetical protein